MPATFVTRRTMSEARSCEFSGRGCRNSDGRGLRRSVLGLNRVTVEGRYGVWDVCDLHLADARRELTA